MCLIKETIAEWKKDNVPLHGAALAYDTIVSLAPLLVIAIGVAGAIFGEEAVRGELVRQIQELEGKEGVVAIQAMIENANRPGSGGSLASVVGFLLLLLMAADCLASANGPEHNRGCRTISFAMVLVIGFLLLVSLLLSSLLVTAVDALNRWMPGLPVLGQALNLVISLVVITVLLASIDKVLPDVRFHWRDLWVSTAATSSCSISARPPSACTSATAALTRPTGQQAHWWFC